MWKGRFREEQTDLLKNFGESISYDWRLYRHDIAGSIAHARALHRAGILNDTDLEAISSGLKEIEGEIAEGKFTFSKDLEDIHMNIEAELTRRIGAAGARLHTARSRNDQVALDMRLWWRDAGTELLGLIRSLQSSLIQFAGRHEGAILPGYTHLQRAQPVLLAHHLLAYVEMFQRDSGRLSDCLGRADVMPLGSGALAGSTIELDRAGVARDLGFAEVSGNSMDAVSDRDFLMEGLSVMAILGVHLSRLSEDFILWCSEEFGFLRLADRHTTGSSLMPQKKNPDIAELTRGRSGRLIGNLVSLLTTMKGLPLTYNRDMQEDKEPFFSSYDTVSSALEIFADMIDGAEFQEDRAARAAADPSLLATDLADFLVLHGVPFRQAHEMVGTLVARAAELNQPIHQLPEPEYKSISPVLSAGSIALIFDPHRALDARRTLGAPSPSDIRERIAHWKGTLAL